MRLGGTPDLNLSGDFHASLGLKKGKDFFEFQTKLDYVNKYVLPKYKDVLGLEPKRDKKWKREIFLPEYNTKIQKHLQIL